MRVALSPLDTASDLAEARLASIHRRVRAAIAQLEGPVDRLPRRLEPPTDHGDTRVAERSAISDLPMSILEQRFALTPTEQTILWTLIAHELEVDTRRMIRAINSEELTDPTTDTLRRIAFGTTRSAETWHALSPRGTLRASGLIARSDTGADTPEHRQTWCVARRVLALVHGVMTVDDALGPLVESDPVAPELTSLVIAGDARDRIVSAIARGRSAIALGTSGRGRRSLLIAAATRPVLVVRGRALATDRDAARTQLQAIARECRLLDRIPLIRDLDALGDRIDLVESELATPFLATSTIAVGHKWAAPPTIVELNALAHAQTVELWERAFPDVPSATCERIAITYPLAPALIAATARATRDLATTAIDVDAVRAGLRIALDDRLGALATRVTVTQSWDDLVLATEQEDAITELVARVQHRSRVFETWGFGAKVGKGLGTIALFSGPPGTGKTMVAGLIARELGTEVYQVDLSKLASKWIGETEKNLAQIFDAAEAGHAILLFDEAEAVFGKRTAVKSSNDRHANHEVNYLLQRLESFTGICLLTTNHESALDDAFRRRLAAHVRFTLPEAAEREQLWRALIPQAAPTAGELRFDRLAHTFELSGGHIKNAVLRAAFLATAFNTAITYRHLFHAACLEYEALGRLTPTSI
jgi:hypothetical protein